MIVWDLDFFWGGDSTTETLQSLPSKKKHQPLRVPAHPHDGFVGSWGEVTLGRSVVRVAIMSNMYSARTCTAQDRTSIKGLRDGELCTSPAVGARAMTLRPADEKSCSSHVSHALLGFGLGLG